MAFAWREFLDHNAIRYITEGRNVKSGHINIKCPFCGDADKHYHLGISPATGHWGCWRNRLHRSKNPARLVAALKGIPWQQAQDIVGEEWVGGGGSISGLLKQAREQLKGRGGDKAPLVEFPDTFQEIEYGDTYWEYLRGRGILEVDLPHFCKYYKIRSAPLGTFRYRVIMPFLGKDKQVMGWQGRAISNNAGVRYLSYPESQWVKKLLFNYGPASSGGRALAVVEGPMDAYKMDYYGREYGFRAIATLGTAVSEHQINLILNLAAQYDYLFLFIDPDALAQAIGLLGRLTLMRPALGWLPAGTDDPGALRWWQVREVFEKNIRLIQ